MNGSPSLNEGGYDYKFVEEPADSLKCLICLLVVREPQQHGGCGKLFCKSCIDKHTLLRNTCCPHCRQPLNNSNGFPTIFNDFRSKWYRSKLSRCPDCGANNQYKNHQVHTKLHCPKRLHSCVHCGENGCFDERTSTHLEVCPKMKIACKKCTQRILRCQLPTHPKECKFEPVPCKYAAVGCKVRPLRKDLKKHEEDYQLHLQVTTETVLELKKMLPKPVAPVAVAPVTVSPVTVSPVTCRVVDFDKRKTGNDVIYKQSFVLHFHKWVQNVLKNRCQR
ncbi:TNF receptor-associated factor 6-like [Halichondria panicea]|uniref:TNF receptor-associated factor 6-like n=1 Tax=Halichondria panicea TaxID=6063 RepID=UPI00312BB04A